MNARSLPLVGLFTAISVMAPPAFAADDFSLMIKDHKFEPETLQIPAGSRVKLTITNGDPTAEEFESRDLHVEKMIPAGQRVTVYVGPLKNGEYSFVGDLHQDSAKGILLAK